jgi:hypothetical protein
MVLILQIVNSNYVFGNPVQFLLTNAANFPKWISVKVYANFD